MDASGAALTIRIGRLRLLNRVQSVLFGEGAGALSERILDMHVKVSRLVVLAATAAACSMI